MHAETILQKCFGAALSDIDVRNVRNLWTAVAACLAGRRLVLMELARQWPGAMKVSAPLKRLDRLLGNRQVQAAKTQVYRAAAQLVIRMPRPVLIVDWSELKADGRWHLLRAGLVLRGRTLTVYEEVHPQRMLGAHCVHQAFLKRLSLLLPSQVQPIVVTDAGFKVPWFKAVEDLGWHWLGRVRGQVGLRPWKGTHEAFQRADRLHAQAGTRARSLGCYALTARHAHACRLVLVKRLSRRRQQLLRRSQRRADSGQARKMARSGREPWVLASALSLSDYPPRRIAALYGRRMQIEASFRDLKSHRYGCAFEDTQTRTAERLEMLLLIYMLASWMAWLCALATIAEREQRFRISLLRGGWEYLRMSQGHVPQLLRPILDQFRELLIRAHEDY